MSTRNDKLYLQLQLIQCIVETDNNDVCARDAETQMQMVDFRIAEITTCKLLFKTERFDCSPRLNVSRPNENHN